MDFGLKAAQTVVNTDKIKKNVERDNKNTIRMMFPNADLGGNDPKFLNENWDEDVFKHHESSKIGNLMPHLRLEASSSISLR